MLIATTNDGKIREIERALAGLKVKFTTLKDLPPVPEPEETGRTFAENARLKAEYYARATGLQTCAEDSGLEIEALDGRPGVHSARYPGATYADKFRNLYRELADSPKPWKARYVCALAVVDAPGGGAPQLLFEAKGTVEGEITARPRGSNGFGYDPIFVYPRFGKTLGEVSDEQKLTVSHRGKAFRLLKHWLEIRA